MKLKVKFSWLFNSPHDAGKAVAAFANFGSEAIVSSLHVDDEQVAPITTSDVTSITVEHIVGKFVKLWRVTVFTAFVPTDDEDADISYSPAIFDGEELPALQTYEERYDHLKGTFRAARGEADDWGRV